MLRCTIVFTSRIDGKSPLRREIIIDDPTTLSEGGTFNPDERDLIAVKVQTEMPKVLPGYKRHSVEHEWGRILRGVKQRIYTCTIIDVPEGYEPCDLDSWINP